MAVVNDAATVPLTAIDGTGAAVTGLTVTASARLAGSGTTVSATATERGSGDYDVAFTPTVVGDWYVKAAATIDGEPALWTETVAVVTAAQADPAAALAGMEVTVVSPVASGGTLTLYQGDDYAGADDRAASWSVALGVADLTGATVALILVTAAGTVLTKTGTVADAGLTTQAVAVAFTAAETAALAPGVATRYDLSAVLASGRAATLTRGPVVVVADEPPA